VNKQNQDWVWAYHTTTKANLESICQYGLCPTWHEHVEDAPVIFVEPDVEGLEPYVDADSVVFRFKTPGFGTTEDGEAVIYGGPGRSGRPDPPFVGDVGSDGVIPPSNLEILYKRRWVNLGRYC
jgi:hypothetical protein